MPNPKTYSEGQAHAARSKWAKMTPEERSAEGYRLAAARAAKRARLKDAGHPA